MLNFRELSLERLLRRILYGRIERRINKKAAVIDLVLRQDQVQIPLHRVHRVIFLDKGQTLGMRSDFRVFCLLGFRWRKCFQRDHSIQNRVALHRRALRIFQRRKTIWTSNQSSEERSFGEI